MTTEDYDTIVTFSIDSKGYNKLLDDGMDELSHLLPRIFEFLDDEYPELEGQLRILVHFRVGFSTYLTD